jgi:predicted RNA-binding protein associated with RNAse of E/G family
MIPPERIKDTFTFEFIRPPDDRVSFKSLLLEARDDLIVVAHASSPSKPVEYLGEIVLDVGYWTVWFLFNGKPFDVGRFYRPDGTWTGYYVDVLEPVRWKASDPHTLEPITDLFLDLWIAPNGKYIVLDEDEFAEAVTLGHLSSAQAKHARNVLQELITATEQRVFPPQVAREFRL